MDIKTIAAGQVLPPRKRRPVSRTDIVRYQGASGDFDAAHHDDAHAQKFGYPHAFSLGMLHAGEISVYATDHLEAEALRAFKVRFKGVVNLSDELTYSGLVNAVRQSPAGPLVDIELTAKNGKEEIVLLARATFLLRG